MKDPALMQEIIDRVGPDAAETVPEEKRKEAPDVLNTLWENWLGLTADLQQHGFSHRTLCDASVAINETFEEIGERAGRTAV